MTTPRPILSPILVAIALFLGLGARAAEQLVTVSLTVTSTPIQGATLTVNGDVRTWTNTLVTPATQIRRDTNNVAGNATNLYGHLATFGFSGPVALGFSSSNLLILRGAVNQTMAVTVSAGWASLATSTNFLTNMLTVRVPAAAEAQHVRRYVADQLVTTLQDNATTNAFAASTPALVNFVDTSETQTIGGAKTFSGDVVLSSVTTTGLVNRGSAISSPGSAPGSEQFGTAATSTGTNGLAVGNSSVVAYKGGVAVGNAASSDAIDAVALGTSALAGSGGAGDEALAVGKSANATALRAIAIGSGAQATGEASVVLGRGASDAGFTNSLVIGTGASATAANQAVIGSTNHTVIIPGNIDGARLTNGNYAGTISALSGGTISSTTITGSTVHATAGVLNGVTVTNAAGIHGVVKALSGGTYDGTLTNSEAWETTFYGNATLAGVTLLQQTNVSSLANGANAGVNFGSTTFARITAGPTAAFSIAGIDGETSGRMLVLWNQTSQNMTLANESGLEATSGQRITTGTGADVVVSGNGGAILVYDGSASRWLLMSYEPPAYSAVTATTMFNGANTLTGFSGPWARITGPTAAFTLHSISGYQDGRQITVWNTTTQNMTIANESGTELTAAARITTMTGADVTSSGACAATFAYDGTAARWILVRFQD